MISNDARERIEGIAIPVGIGLIVLAFLFLLTVVPAWIAEHNDHQPHVKVTTTQTKEIRP